MDIEVSLPLDNDGFLRRECPHCMQQFKWHHGPANAEAEEAEAPHAYHCPLCGQPAGHDSWFTQVQIGFIEQAAAPAATRFIEAELDKVFRNSSSKSLNLKLRRTGHLDTPDHPDPLAELDDMTIVASPCHGYEPVKVSEEHTGPLYCLVCGAAFAV